MRKCTRIISYMLVCILCLLPLKVVAAETLDTTRTGSIMVVIQDSKGPVAGGSLRLYKVADVDTEDGNYFFVYQEAFADCDLSLDELETERLSDGTLALEMAEWAIEHEVSYEVLPVGITGLATAEELSVGLYMITQEQASEGYEPINPFFVTIPIVNGDELVYDVNASPKPSTITEKPETPDKPNPPGKVPSKLPQTGQLWWPVPILSFMGVLFFTLGWKRRSTSKKD